MTETRFQAYMLMSTLPHTAAEIVVTSARYTSLLRYKSETYTPNVDLKLNSNKVPLHGKKVF